MAPHLCILNSLHPPDDIRVVEKMAASLLEMGCKVSWVGPTGVVKNRLAGLEYHFFPPPRNRAERLLLGPFRLFRLGKSLQGVDGYMGVEPDSAAVAAMLSKITGKKSIFDVHEPYGEETLQTWASGLTLKVLRVLVSWGLKAVGASCDLIIGVSESVLKTYVTLKTPRLVIRNCARQDFAAGHQATPDARGEELSFTVVQGKATRNHGTPVLLAALGLARETLPTLKCVFFDVLHLPGSGITTDQFWEMARESGAEGVVQLQPPVPMKEIPTILSQCHVGVVCYTWLLGQASLPNKLFEFMALGLPVIAPSYASEICDVVQREQCGLLVDCENPKAIAQALIYLHEHPEEARQMGERGRQGFIERHSFEADARPFKDFLTKVSMVR